MNPFAEKYKTLNNSALLKIIDNPGDYQPLAVEAAQNELAIRNLSAEELAGANAENEQEQTEKQARAERAQAFKNKVGGISNNVIETIHPIQQTPVSLNRIILLVSIVFGILGLVQFYFLADYGIAVIHYPQSFSFSYIGFLSIYFFQGAYSILAAFLFWRRKKWGWIFLSVYLCFSAVGAILLILVETFRTHISVIDNIIPPVSFASGLYTLLFFGCCTWFFYRGDVRAVYGIDKYLGIITASVGVFLAMLACVLH